MGNADDFFSFERDAVSVVPQPVFKPQPTPIMPATTPFSEYDVTIKDVVYTVVYSSDVLEAPSKGGKKYWQGHVVCDQRGRYYTATSSWQDTKDGLSKVNWSTPYYAEPKNIGRSSETTNNSQAIFEFNSMVDKEKRIRLSEHPLPMLAKVFADRKSKIKYPVFVQPKLDGNRMLTNGVENWTRKNKPIDEKDKRVLAHILPLDTEGLILDGELMLKHMPKVSFTNSAIKRYQEGVTENLRYYVYDFIDLTGALTFRERFALLSDWHNSQRPDNVILVKTLICQNEEEILLAHAEFIAMGYEGTMVRDPESLYAVNRRVDSVLKYKDFVDEEFEIVDIIPAGGGSSADVGKFVCKTDSGVVFDCTATGSEEERRELLNNKAEYIGQYAKVKYREYGVNGAPVHGNVLEIRETKTGGY
jgi:ATP-dependent DNA ligase